METSKYTKEPWRSTEKELPSYGGAVCMCYNTFCNCEMMMVFHKARKDSGYKDYFTAGGRFYDYDWIKYWRYYYEKETD